MQVLILNNKVASGINAIFSNYISDLLGCKVGIYLKNPAFAKVKFMKRHGVFQTCIILNEGEQYNIVAKGDGNSPNIRKSLNKALSQVIIRLEKYKDKKHLSLTKP